MDMECYDCVSPDEQSPVGVEELEKAISDINWRCGHSGQLLSEEDAEILNDLWRKTFEKNKNEVKRKEPGAIPGSIL